MGGGRRGGHIGYWIHPSLRRLATKVFAPPYLGNWAWQHLRGYADSNVTYAILNLTYALLNLTYAGLCLAYALLMQLPWYASHPVCDIVRNNEVAPHPNKAFRPGYRQQRGAIHHYIADMNSTVIIHNNSPA